MSTETTEDIPKTVTKKSRKSRKDDGSLLPDPTVESKNSKRQKMDVDQGKSEFDVPRDVEVKKAKKKKHRPEGEGGEEVTGGTETAVTDERKKKRKRKREESTPDDHKLGMDEDELKADGAHDISVENAEIGNSEKKKKRKKERTQVGEDEKKKKKKRKTEDTGLPDPNEDTSLADQARRALAYAYTQFDDPGSWKFNKARQNWLIRNVWSDQTIPELYMPLLTRYLANVKGGIRENLITTCKSILPSSVTAPADPPSLLPAESKESVADNTKQLRARVILDVLSAKY